MRPFVLALAAFAVAAAPLAAEAAKKKPPAATNTTAAAATPAAKPAPAAKAAPAAAKTTAATGPSTGAGSKMKTCAAEWKSKSKADQDGYSTKGKAMKSKKGNPLTGYQAWTSECMKKA